MNNEILIIIINIFPSSVSFPVTGTLLTALPRVPPALPVRAPSSSSPLPRSTKCPRIP